MGLTRITQAVQALNDAGLSAGRSFPAAGKAVLSAPAITVGIYRCAGESVTLAVSVFATPEMGGSLCEDRALEAVAVLEGLGASCTQEACSYDRTSGLLSVRILAAWEPEDVDQSEEEAIACTVTVSGVALPYLTGVKAQHTVELYPVNAVGEGAAVLRREVKYWDVTVEEFLPLSKAPASISTGVFALKIVRSTGTERYASCRWIHVLREDTPQGIRQVRVGRSYEEREIIT